MSKQTWLRSLTNRFRHRRARRLDRGHFTSLCRLEALESRWVPTGPTAVLSGPGSGVTQQPLTYTLSVIDDLNFTAETEYTFEIDWDHDDVYEQIRVVSGTQVTYAFPNEGTINVRIRLPDQTEPTSFVVDVSWALIQSGDLLIGGSPGDNCTISESAQAGDLHVTVGSHSETFKVPGSVHIYGDAFSYVTLNGKANDGDQLINSVEIELNGRQYYVQNLSYWVYSGLGGDDTLTLSVDAYREVDFYGGDGHDVVDAQNVVGADWYFVPPDQNYFTEDFVQLSVTGADFNFYASGMEELIGSHGNDQFFSNPEVSFTGSIDSGDGDDVFYFSSDISFTGSIAGGGGHDTMDYSALAGPLPFHVGTTSFPFVTEATGIDGIVGTQSSFDELIGGSSPNLWHMNANNSGTVNDLTFESFEIMTGGAGYDRIVSGNSNIHYDWHFTGANSGTLNRTVYSTTFSGFENVTCGGYYDTVFFTPGDEFDGDIDCGGYGSLNYSALAGLNSVNLETGQFPHISGSVLGPGVVVGTSSLNDEIIGPNADATWLLHGKAFYGPNFAFHNFETIRGGSGDDLFHVTNSAILSGLLDGGGGANSISVGGDPEDAIAVGVQINLAAQRITSVWNNLLVNEFQNISAFDGTIATYWGFVNTLIGDHQNTTWTIGADGSGTRGDIAFYGFQNFVGGSGSDNFEINGGNVSFNGGDGSDNYVVNFGNLGADVQIGDTGTTGSDTLILNGTSSDDVLNKPGGTVQWKPAGETQYLEQVDFSGLESGTLNAVEGNDTILDPDTTNWILLGGLGDDYISVTGAVGSVTIDAGPGNNTVVITMGELAGPISVNGSTGSTKIVVFAPEGENTLTLTSTALTSGNETVLFNLGATDFGITIDGSAGDNKLVLQGPPPAPLTPINIDVESVTPSTTHGLVYLDFNNDGEVNFGERAIEGVTVTLSGVDDLGNSVMQSVQTDAQGIYAFTNLRPSNAAGYMITQSQPAGYLDGIDSLGDLGGDDSVNDVFSGIVLHGGLVAADYNFGERPMTTGGVVSGQTATIGFWQNKNGQNLIIALNGGSTATQLGNWLATTFPNMYGSLAGKTNAEVATHYKSLFAKTAQSSLGGPPKLDAQVMATALAVYVTNQTLAGTTATAYGFLVTQYGVGAATFNVGNNGAAFGFANNANVSIMDLLLAVDDRSHNGVLFDIDGSGTISSLEASFRTMANAVFSAINEAGGV